MCPTNSTWSGSRFPCKMKRWKTKRLWFASKGCWQKQLLLALLGDRFICLSGFGLPCSTAELHPPTELLSLSGIFRSSPEPKWMGPLANMKQIWPWNGPCYSKVPINSMEKNRGTNMCFSLPKVCRCFFPIPLTIFLAGMFYWGYIIFHC